MSADRERSIAGIWHLAKPRLLETVAKNDLKNVRISPNIVKQHFGAIGRHFVADIDRDDHRVGAGPVRIKKCVLGLFAAIEGSEDWLHSMIRALR